MDIIEKINNQIADNKILLYMKGSPDKPECGFSQRASQILMAVSYTHLTLPTKDSV